MACRSCLNKDNWRPGINQSIARIQRNSFSAKCKYTKEQVVEIKDRIVCLMHNSESALNKYTLNVYITILMTALNSRNYCDARLVEIENELDGTNCQGS